MGGGDHPGEGVEEAWLGVAPMYWSSWDVATSRRLMGGAGFVEVDVNLEGVNEDGRQVLCLWVVGYRPAEPTGKREPGRNCKAFIASGGRFAPPSDSGRASVQTS
jgi:hypothetical protein